MDVIESSLPGVLIIKPKVLGDERGYFVESYHHTRYQQAGIPGPFVQDNLSLSKQGTLRGLHLQHPHSQGKLVSVLQGEVFDVAVDVRVGSPHFGQWISVTLSQQNKHQLYIPAGFAHGFCVTSDEALFTYKCSELYHPESEVSILWNDSDIGIVWPSEQPQLSKKDQQALPLSKINQQQLPRYEEK
ncbi:MAG: dTDP-4-dehydrorhamnose 3,5-epimerase [Thiotrichaceae bacterium]|nr:dTDP-4-dehydrorhamnose 3,5-epimerase [Thiotrichaceae bacterium]PCI10354.1 MAG: dTDP-4-dehydrorhamnose 3,5-epimerase [Thiotrichales bacterium]